MNFNDLKEICKEHDKLLKKTEIIEKCKKERHWMDVITPENARYRLGDEEIKLLKDFYEEKGLEIERMILKLLSNKK